MNQDVFISMIRAKLPQIPQILITEVCVKVKLFSSHLSEEISEF